LCLVVLLTPWGLRRITPMLEARLSELLSLEVSIEDPVLSWPLTLRVESILATDAEGQVRMEIREAGLRVSLRQLLKGRARVHRLSIESLRYRGVPAALPVEETDSEWDLPLRLPDMEMLFEKVMVRDLHIHRVRLEPPFVPEPIELSLQGSFSNRIVEAELELLEMGDQTYSPSPRLSLSLDTSPYNRFQNRDLELTAGAEGFANLIPNWPDTLEDELELFLDLRETRETLLLITKGYLLNPVGELRFGGELDLTTARLSSAWELSIPDLARLRAWLPIDLTGAICLDANLEGALDDLSLDVHLTSEDLGIVDQTLNVDLAYASRLSRLTREGVLTAKVEAEDFGKAEGRVRLSGGRVEVEVDPLDLVVAGMEFSSENRLQLSMEGSQFHLEPLHLRLGKGRLRMSGEFKDDQLDFTAEILEFPASGLVFVPWIDPTAELTGTLHLTGHPAQPEAVLSLDFKGLRPEDPDAWDGPPARFRVEASMAEQVVKAELRLEDLPGDAVTLDVVMPLDFSLVPFHLTWPPQGDLEAHLQANTNLAGLSRLFVLDVYHTLSGMLKVDVRLTGTAKDPQVHGSIEMVSGRYEHELSGALLQDMSFLLTAERDYLSLSRFEAKDGIGGTVSASGRVEFKPAERYPFAAQVELQNFRFMQNDQVEAGGEGRLEVRGTLDESRLTGRVLLAPLNLTLPESLPPRLYELEVVEVYAENDPRGEKPEPETTETETALRHRLIYDFTVEAPARVFVRGRGLDSEWSALIKVKGEGAEPRLSGDLTLIRGRFQFFGKRLQLNRGIVTFDG
ncbi:MAG: translocation/assembly module TamB domain-containing protein, partial [Kiritimatiellae bacterium]|nr:translocation/assembly module TamB domain-containing protein [Kiritimatiellia bacterium]